MAEIHKLLRVIRGKDSLRIAAEKTGLSHNYISVLEKGFDPRTKSVINPSPETLKAYSKGYKYPYAELMAIAGYVDEEFDKRLDKILNQFEEMNKSNNSNDLISNRVQQTRNEFIIKEIVEKYNVDLTVPENREKLEKIIQLVLGDQNDKKNH